MFNILQQKLMVIKKSNNDRTSKTTIEQTKSRIITTNNPYSIDGNILSNNSTLGLKIYVSFSSK